VLTQNRMEDQSVPSDLFPHVYSFLKQCHMPKVAKAFKQACDQVTTVVCVCVENCSLDNRYDENHAYVHVLLLIMVFPSLETRSFTLLVSLAHTYV